MKARKGSCQAPTQLVLNNIRRVLSKVKRKSSHKKKRFRKSKHKKSRSKRKRRNKRSRK